MNTNATRSSRSRQSSLALMFFGCCVVTSGLWRFLSAEGGHVGLWFGLVMGGLAMASSWFFWKGHRVPGNCLAVATIALVGGWFCYESFIRKGWANAEFRQLLVIGVTLFVAVIVMKIQVFDSRSTAPHSGQNRSDPPAESN